MIKEFTVGASHTINLGNYESLRIEASVTIDPDGDARPFEAIKDEAQLELRRLLEETYKAQREKREGKPRNGRLERG